MVGFLAGLRGFLRSNSTARFFAVLFPLLLLSTVACAEAAAKKGSFAFYYTRSLTEEELAWFQRFDVVVSGDILPPSQVQALHEAGSQVFYYAWSTGTYIDDPKRLDPNSWDAQVYSNRKTWLLNPNQPDEGPDGGWRTYYYDPFSSSFQKAWSQYLNSTRLSADYDGVFFDLVGSASVPSYLLKVYASRHRKVPYDRSLADAFQLLKQKRSKIFTNRGLSRPQYYLPIADYDLTESMITSDAWGEQVQIYLEGRGLTQTRETYYRPWAFLKWDVDTIQGNVERYNPAVKISHLNYMNPAYQPTGQAAWVDGTAYPVYREVVDRAAIYFGYVGAKLWGHDSYSHDPTANFQRDEIYFTDLGEPLGTSYEERDGVVLRYYEKGVVVLNPSTASQTVDLSSPLVPPGVSGLQDLYDDVTLLGLTVTIDPAASSASGRVYPSGRVYLYRS